MVREINAGTFGNAYRGSALRTVVGSVAEQRQIFKGADHAFLWKPKLRIPDIYENAANQQAFARFLHTCNCCNTADEVVEAMHRVDSHRIKGLGPAAADLLYFIHPTLVMLFNTAIVKVTTRSDISLRTENESRVDGSVQYRLKAISRDLVPSLKASKTPIRALSTFGETCSCSRSSRGSPLRLALKSSTSLGTLPAASKRSHRWPRENSSKSAAS